MAGHQLRLNLALGFAVLAVPAALTAPVAAQPPAEDRAAKALYWLPYEDGTTRVCVQANNTHFSHSGNDAWAFDFGMPEGTKVCAARAGKVVEVQQDYTEGALRADLKGKANRVAIDHGDGVVTRYLHLKPHGALVAVGDVVNAGDVIGLSGATGYVSGPHLHFGVFKAWTSQPSRFEDVPDNGGVPLEGKPYVSHNTPAVSPALREKLTRQVREARLAWGADAFGLAFPRYREVAETKLTVAYPAVTEAKEKLAELEKRCDEALAASAKDAAEGKLDAAAERLLLAQRSFQWTPCAKRLEQALNELKKQDGYAVAAKAAEKPVQAQSFFLRGLDSELKGYWQSAATAYDDCVKLQPDSPYAQSAAARRAEVRARMDEQKSARR